MLHPWAKRQRQERTRESPCSGKSRYLARAGVKHDNRNQWKGVKRNERAKRTNGECPPQPLKLRSQ